MADPPSPAPMFRNTDAPFVYFDAIATQGVLNGAVQIDLVSRILIPGEGTSVIVEFVPTGRLRCTPAAAGLLRDSINQALDMLNQPQQPGTPAGGAAASLH
jgi:hypothetical protein